MQGLAAKNLQNILIFFYGSIEFNRYIHSAND